MRSLAPTPWLDLVALAERQEGLVRRHELVAVGSHPRHVRRLVLAGQLHELHRGVYAVGHRAITRRAQFVAAVWWVGEDAALSHESAGASYEWIVEETAPWPDIHVSTVHDRVKSKPGVIVHRTRHLEHRDVITLGGLRITDRVRTLVDLADHLGPRELRQVADHLPSLPTARLEAVAARLPGRRGAGRLAALIHSEDAHTRSAMERRYVRYCATHDVPHPVARNVRVHGVAVDCWYEQARLVVELDSRAHHTRRREMEADRLRDRRLKRQGVDTLRLVWADLAPADPLAARDVRQRLGLGNW
jgi:Transcriptional regulator, AbiEi antitoxin/Protein of unknown function (DUF559)